MLTHWILMSLVLGAGLAGAASHVPAHAVTLERPRDVLELRTTPAFVEPYRAIWAVLREEVIKHQRPAVDGRRAVRPTRRGGRVPAVAAGRRGGGRGWTCERSRGDARGRTSRGGRRAGSAEHVRRGAEE